MSNSPPGRANQPCLRSVYPGRVCQPVLESMVESDVPLDVFHKRWGAGHMHSQLTAQRGKSLPLGSVLSRCGLIGLVLFVSACTTGSSTTATPTPVPTSHSPSGMIKHIVFFVKENRTFDNYFGTYPGAHGARFAMDSAGKLVPLQHEQDVLAGDIDHSSAAARQAYDNGKLDDFDQLASFSAQTGQPLQSHSPYSNNSLTQFYQSD